MYELYTLKTEPEVPSEVLVQYVSSKKKPHHFPEHSESAVTVQTVQCTFLIYTGIVRFWSK